MHTDVIPTSLSSVKGLHHAGITVADLKVSEPFYKNVFGFDKAFEFTWEKGTPSGITAGNMSGLPGSTARAVMLVKNGTFLELFEFQHPGSDRSDDRGLNQQGLTHICFNTDDVLFEYHRLVDSGVRFLSEPIEAGPMKIAYCLDPDGNFIEILQLPSGA